MVINYKKATFPVFEIWLSYNQPVLARLPRQEKGPADLMAAGNQKWATRINRWLNRQVLGECSFYSI